jgi:hypothetical protein
VFADERCCVNCGKPFTPTSSSQRFCMDRECQLVRKREENRRSKRKLQRRQWSKTAEHEWSHIDGVHRIERRARFILFEEQTCIGIFPTLHGAKTSLSQQLQQ